MVVVVWIAEIGWQAAVDAARELAPRAEIVLVHVIPGDMEEVVHGAFAGLLGRHRSVPRGVDEAAEADEEQLLADAAARLDRPATLDKRRGPGGTRDRRRRREGRPADPEPGRRPVPARTALAGAAHPVRGRSRAMRGAARLARLGAGRRHHPAATGAPAGAPARTPAGPPSEVRPSIRRRRVLEPARGGVRDGKAFSVLEGRTPRSGRLKKQLAGPPHRSAGRPDRCSAASP